MSKKPVKVSVARSAQPNSAPPAAEPVPAPWAPFDMLRQEIDRLFEDFTPAQLRRSWLSTPGLFGRATEWPVAPAVDLTEQNGSFLITAELPGIAPSDVEVKLADGMLTIRGEKKQETDREEADYRLSERRYGIFRRSFSLPDSVDADKIEASFANGVLTVTMPKSEKARASEKKIKVKAA